jgi:putative ATP-dependent endonuclease of the OLD family
LDAAILDTAPIDGEDEADANFRAKCARSEKFGADRKVALEAFCAGNPWLELFLADHTFEVDFVKAGNSRAAKATVNKVYSSPPTIAEAISDFDSGDLARYGRRILTMANQEGKGWFAILLSKYITTSTVIPRYVLEAIFHAHPMPSTEVWFNILSYRFHLQDEFLTPEEQLKDFGAKLRQFRKSEISFHEIADAMLELDKDDVINPILARFI